MIKRALILLVAGVIAQPVYAGEKTVLTLKDGMDIVAHGGRDVRIAVHGEKMARADKDIAGSALLPQVTVKAAQNFYAYQPAAVFGGAKAPTSQRSFPSAGVDVYQTIYDFGRDRFYVKAAEKLRSAAEDETFRSRQQSVLDFVSAYFDLLEADKMILVAREELTSLSAHLHDIAIFFREGTVTKNEFLESEVRFRMARQKVVTLKNQRKLISSRLVLLAFQPKDAEIEAKDVDLSVPQDIALSSAEARAITERPEVLTLAKAVEASTFREQANRALDYPTLYGDGGFSYAQNRYQARNDNFEVQLGVQMSVFNGGRTEAQVEKEHERRKQLEEEKLKLEEAIRLEVERAFRDIQNAREALSASRASVGSAAENARVMDIQYKEGAATSTNVLDAVALKTSAETIYWRGTYELKRAWGRFLFAAGIDLNEEYLSGRGIMAPVPPVTFKADPIDIKEEPADQDVVVHRVRRTRLSSESIDPSAFQHF